MEIEKKTLVAGFLITSLILFTVIFSNTLMNNKRESVITERMDALVEDYEEMQSLSLLSEYFSKDATCAALGAKLSKMNKELWGLGGQIDAYRQATKEFAEDPFYLAQKRKFNTKEVLYFTLFKQMNDVCAANQTVVSYFYRKKEYCPDCDAQSFILSDVKNDLDRNKDYELAVFSFDVDLELSSISLLKEFYNVTSYPCIVVNDVAHCGLYNKEAFVSMLCGEGNLSICSNGG